jgi:hypothetical protein
MLTSRGVSLEELTEVDEAVPGKPRQRHPRALKPPDAPPI